MEAEKTADPHRLCENENVRENTNTCVRTRGIQVQTTKQERLPVRIEDLKCVLCVGISTVRRCKQCVRGGIRRTLQDNVIVGAFICQSPGGFTRVPVRESRNPIECEQNSDGHGKKLLTCPLICQP